MSGMVPCRELRALVSGGSLGGLMRLTAVGNQIVNPRHVVIQRPVEANGGGRVDQALEGIEVVLLLVLGEASPFFSEVRVGTRD